MNHDDTFALMMDMLDGEASENQVRTLEAHLRACPECEREWRALVAIDTLFRQTPALSPAADFVEKTLARLPNRRARIWAMGAIYGAKTDDIEMYHKVFDLPEINNIEVKINRIDTPEVQRIRIETDETGAELDARNRGGGRVAIIDAKPSVQEAVHAAERLGIELTD